MRSSVAGAPPRPLNGFPLGHIVEVSGRYPWVRLMVFVAVAYVVIGVGSAALDKSVRGGPMHPWRLAAWVASVAVAAAHLRYEHDRLGSSPSRTAMRVTGAVALGAFGAAVAANVHWLFAVETRGGRSPLLALPVWPVVGAIPTFLVALAAATVLARFSRRA